jgi:carboxypeptidase Taq
MPAIQTGSHPQEENCMQNKIDELKKMMAEVIHLQNVLELLSWDQQVNMAPGGTDDRGAQMAIVNRTAHLKFTSDEVGKLLVDLQPYMANLDPDSDEARLIKVTTHKYKLATKVPADFVARRARATATGRAAWEKAKRAGDFSLFQPQLENIFDLNREFVEFFAPYDHIYDPLLDRFEPNMKTGEVIAIFDALRPAQVALVQEIATQPQVDDSFLHQQYDKQRQWDFGVQVITDMGYDWECGRQDYSTHPFTSSFGSGDVRITTRIYSDFLNPALFATTHECGHALYEQGFDPALAHTHLDDAASLAIHESQSRMWENLIGRSRPFWEKYYPQLQATFPSQLGNIDLERFYKGINKVEPSLIRVEADEATYNLHIMLRLELEIATMEGKIAIKDLPEAWNQKMEEYLGITPANDAVGVLQDTHWASGLVGYFSTYALGNLISVQFWNRIEEDIPDLDNQIRQGDFAALLDWGRQHVHRHGAKFEPQELVKRITGSPIDSQPYVNYLRDKYTEIYQL